MATKVDGRPTKIDVWANPLLDGEAIRVEGFPSTYFAGATVTAVVSDLAGVAAGAAWTVDVDDTIVTLTLPQASVAAIGEGTFTWTVVVSTSAGAKPPLIGGALYIHKGHKPTWRSSASGAVCFEGYDLTITQILANAVDVIDGGTPDVEPDQTLDGGTP